MSVCINKLKLIKFALIIIVCLSSTNLSFAEADDRIDIGLVFANNNQYPIGISSDKGFEFGTDESGTFTQLIDFTNEKSLIIYKAGYYDALGNLDEQPSEYYTSGLVKGAYTVQIGSDNASLNSLLSTYDLYKQNLPEICINYDDGWYFSVGEYVNKSEAKSSIVTWQSYFPNDSMTVKKRDRTQVIAYSNGLPIVSYASKNKAFEFNTDVFELNGVKYRNGLVVKRMNGSDFTIINRLTMSEYLYGVLPKEMSGDWPIEALKAQAIAARNYTMVNLNKHDEYGFDLCATTDCQVYGGYSVEKPRSNQAVNETEGLVLYYKDEVVSCYYHSNSGGQTEDISNIWSGDLPYIKGIIDPFSLNQPKSDWTLTLSADTITKALMNAGYDIGTYQGAEIEQVSDNFRVTRLIIYGSKSSTTLLKEQARSIFGYTVLKSMYFNFGEEQGTEIFGLSSEGEFSMAEESTYVISAAGITELGDDKAIFNGQTVSKIPKSIMYESNNSKDLLIYGKGYGHGLGMSQWGAKAMAELGYNYEEILLHYYTDTYIKRL